MGSLPDRDCWVSLTSDLVSLGLGFMDFVFLSVLSSIFYLLLLFCFTEKYRIMNMY